MSGRFLNWNYSTNAFFGWLGQLTGDHYNAVVLAICLVMLKWLFLYFMYKKKIFLRV
jgi:predicted acyltransferase